MYVHRDIVLSIIPDSHCLKRSSIDMLLRQASGGSLTVFKSDGTIEIRKEDDGRVGAGPREFDGAHGNDLNRNCQGVSE